MVAANLRTDETRRIEDFLRKRFADAHIEAYRYNPAAIRVRIIDELFAGKSRSEREAIVDPVLAELPPELEGDITLLLLLTNDEKEESLTNLEFERPSMT